MDFGQVGKEEVTGFSNSLDMSGERKEAARVTPRFMSMQRN